MAFEVANRARRDVAHVEPIGKGGGGEGGGGDGVAACGVRLRWTSALDTTTESGGSATTRTAPPTATVGLESHMEKNWLPFVHDDWLYVIYSLCPEQIVLRCAARRSVQNMAPLGSPVASATGRALGCRIAPLRPLQVSCCT